MKGIAESNELRQSGLTQFDHSTEEAWNELLAMSSGFVLLQQQIAEPLFEAVGGCQKLGDLLPPAGAEHDGAAVFSLRSPPRTIQCVLGLWTYRRILDRSNFRPKTMPSGITRSAGAS